MNLPDEEIQRQWLEHHFVPDKDAALEQTKKPVAKRSAKKQRRRHPAAWEMPIPDCETDLHGYSGAEAEALVEEQMKTMERAKLSVLRIIHGGGNPGYGNVKKTIDRCVRTVWKHRILFYKLEPDNAGSSILKIKLPAAGNK